MELTFDQIADVTLAVYGKLVAALDPTRIVIGVSNRHVHLAAADLMTLFGLDEFTVYRQVRQPGEFAAEQRVNVHGPKASFRDVRCMGPCRAKTQVELSLTDCRALGLTAPITQSGHLDEATAVEIEGPMGTIRRPAAMVAARHIHMGPSHAEVLQLRDQDLVKVGFDGARGGVLDNFIVRIKPLWVPEIHLDVDEANALGVQQGDVGQLMRSRS